MLLPALLAFLLAAAALFAASTFLSRQPVRDQDSRLAQFLSISVLAGSVVALASLLALLIAIGVAFFGD